MAKNVNELLHNHLPLNIRIQCTQNNISQTLKGEPAVKNRADDNFPTLKKYRSKHIERLEKQYLEQLLIKTGGVIDQSQKISGLSSSRIYRLLKVYEIKGLKKH
ncbi:MAG: hypothetical protein R6U27_09930 [Desulfobacterales bacterium]